MSSFTLSQMLLFYHLAILQATENYGQEGISRKIGCLATSCGLLPLVERLFKAASSSPALKQDILRAPYRDYVKFFEAVNYPSVGDSVWNDQGDFSVREGRHRDRRTFAI